MTQKLALTPFPEDRKVFCNRTLNMRSIRAIGYDMDYTLVHYRVEEWEKQAYGYIKQHFLTLGWPVEALEFDPSSVCRGLIIDTKEGNLLKANRFGFVKRAMHGTQAIPLERQQATYSRMIVELSDDRWVFLNTLFSLSEGCMYAQLVDLFDRKLIPEVASYEKLYQIVRQVIDAAHMEGKLKADILADPERFIVLDEETALTLLDQHFAGKKLLLITNSEWSYTGSVMSYCLDRFLPKNMTWRSLFDVIIVGARKPTFFSMKNPFLEIVTEDGLLKPLIGKLNPKSAYLGGSAQELEKHLQLSGDQILYVGDHMFGDVRASKNVLRWRTALILRELEDEVRELQTFLPKEVELAQLMKKKEGLEEKFSEIRVKLQRISKQYGTPISTEEAALHDQANEIKAELSALDPTIAPLAEASSHLLNAHWGLLMRTGNDKSYLAFQLERYADIYTSRVSNFLYLTPFAYLRSPRGSLPHDSPGSHLA